MNYQYIKTEQADLIATIRFDHYSKRNALSECLIEEMHHALEVFGKEDVRVLVLRSDQKNRVWSAGHDVMELPRSERDPLPADDPVMVLLKSIRAFRAPVIAMVDGSVWGASTDLIMSCDIAIGDHDSTFAITPAKLGLPYTASGILHFMSRMPLNVVKEMFLTADPIGADRALQIGILNHLYVSGELETKTYQMARTIAKRSPQANSVLKAQAQMLSDAAVMNPAVFEYLQSLRKNVYMGSDYKEGITAFLEKREPVFGQADIT
ncbi:methylmalonyl-CoA decarboxylase [Polynucleobacter paneuropaeus]|uniref:methylmalonyl-CoA decarboxylase n=1 Tax=Polynucleobacter paneuropaeus TaxID=2527775 RepID=UPI000DBF2264|nr:methylmalonyl-CoA decarboxylase [Polynucleobacter paneuropaeus]AWW46604.1 methylmalonyl-CoA decarboxylase [Polynucleobacter paneuropaeus]